ncbi:MAG: hypothetical protein AAFO04_24865 [Cyanobacteria bacterium J06592_8]
MTLCEIKKKIAQLLACHPDDLTPSYLKSIMRKFGYIPDFRKKAAWLRTLDILRNYFSEQDRVFMGTGMNCVRQNPFYNFSHIPTGKNCYYHKETNWNITHKLQYSDPAFGAVTRDVWIIFIPDRAVYEIRRIRLRREYLDGRYEETIYDYVPDKVTALTTL